MTIRELRILPPIAIARLGSADKPLDCYTVEDDPDRPLDFRVIRPLETLEIDETSGEVVPRMPTEIAFKDEQERIRPVAPFLEVFALTDDGRLVPLTTEILAGLGLGDGAVSWRVSVGNRKVVRRTNDRKDEVLAETDWFSDHGRHELPGHCPNFVSKEASIAFGHVRYIRPSLAFPQIRLRFTPAKGLIYGPKLAEPASAPDIYQVPEDRAIYDTKKGGWWGFQVPKEINNNDPDYSGPFFDETLPPSLFAIDPPAPCWLYDNVAVSRGYFDDACDGIVEAKLTLGDGRELVAAARIASAPPAMVPDTLFLRTLADDLDQVLHGPKVPDSEPAEVTRARALDIIRRAFETVRFLNVAVMNGNPVQGRDPLLFDTMPAEEAFDTERLMRPVVPERTADTLMIQALHQQVFAALRGGAAPWFGELLRKPDQVADFTDHGRRKMPAMMCGADGSYLALTWRQIDTILRASRLGAGGAVALGEVSQVGGGGAQPSLTPRNLSAQLHYAAVGNPVSSRPVTSIGNCTPGLEFDFRAVWRRVFRGIVLREWDNLVVEMDPDWKKLGLPDLRGHRLLRIDGKLAMTQMLGPSPADPETRSVVVATDANPEGVAPLEWSNLLAPILAAKQGGTVQCDFTKEAVWLKQEWWGGKDHPHVEATLEVRRFFEPSTAVISRELAAPGELTQGLCSPWQNDYRECSCYYWASARPDYVNVEPTPSGASRGDNWMQKQRVGEYVADDYQDTRLLMYDDLFRAWERVMKFQIRGRDASKSAAPVPAPAPAPAVSPAPAAEGAGSKRRKS